MHIIICGVWETGFEGFVKRLARSSRHIRQPVRHGNHFANACLTNRRRRTQGVAVESVKLTVKTDFFGGFDEQGQIVAKITRQHRLRSAGFDFDGIGHKVFHTAQGMQFITHNRHIGTL